MYKRKGGGLHHVKPHGALYTMAAKDPALSQAIAEAVFKLDSELVLYGLAGSELIKAGEKLGLLTAQEAFADRTYQQNGFLSPRNQAGAVITEVEVAVKQAVSLVEKGRAKTTEGKEIMVNAETICIHGDSFHAVEFARKIYLALIETGVKIAPISRNS